MSADRIGVNKKTKTGPLAKASFEQTEDIMLRAALFGEMDPVTGVSANIMTGQPIRGGTTFTQVLLDALLDRRVLLSCDHTEVHMRRCGGWQGARTFPRRRKPICETLGENQARRGGQYPTTSPV